MQRPNKQCNSQDVWHKRSMKMHCERPGSAANYYSVELNSLGTTQSNFRNNQCIENKTSVLIILHNYYRFGTARNFSKHKLPVLSTMKMPTFFKRKQFNVNFWTKNNESSMKFGFLSIVRVIHPTTRIIPTPTECNEWTSPCSTLRDLIFEPCSVKGKFLFLHAWEPGWKHR